MKVIRTFFFICLMTVVVKMNPNVPISTQPQIPLLNNISTSFQVNNPKQSITDPNTKINVQSPPSFDINKLKNFSIITKDIQQNKVSGTNNKIDGKNNSLIGNDNNVIGKQNVIEGNSNSLDGQQNSIWGTDNKILGSTNTIIGQKNKNLGEENQLVGDNNNVVGGNNSALGNNNNIVGQKNYIWGVNNIMKGENNMAAGVQNVIDGNSSIIKGEMNTNSGNDNVILGRNNHVIGRNNQIGTGRAVGPSIEDFQNSLFTKEVLQKYNLKSMIKSNNKQFHQKAPSVPSTIENHSLKTTTTPVLKLTSQTATSKLKPNI